MSGRVIEMIVIGASYGGIEALKVLLPTLSRITSLPVVIVVHIKASRDSYFPIQLNNLCRATVIEARERAVLKEDHIYIAPGGYHLLIENDKSLSFSEDAPVCFSRPSIDVLFQSASLVFDNKLLGVLLTGANEDGAEGIEAIHQRGGITVAQDPATAVMNTMPQAAIDTGEVDYIVPLKSIAAVINNILQGKPPSLCMEVTDD